MVEFWYGWEANAWLAFIHWVAMVVIVIYRNQKALGGF